MKYGSPPKLIKNINLEIEEYFFYLYLPIKLKGSSEIQLEKRLRVFDKLIGAANCDYIGLRGLDSFVNSYIYLTAKRMLVKPDKPFNRPGWHSDGFGTDDINYIWSDKFPTIFNSSKFTLSSDENKSLIDMEDQSLPENNYCYKENDLLRLDQYNIHCIGPITEITARTFLKVSFSEDKYNLQGNSKNYDLDYDWEMIPRKMERNVPQNKI